MIIQQNYEDTYLHSQQKNQRYAFQVQMELPKCTSINMCNGFIWINI